MALVQTRNKNHNRLTPYHFSLRVYFTILHVLLVKLPENLPLKTFRDLHNIFQGVANWYEKSLTELFLLWKCLMSFYWKFHNFDVENFSAGVHQYPYLILCPENLTTMTRLYCITFFNKLKFCMHLKGSVWFFEVMFIAPNIHN